MAYAFQTVVALNERVGSFPAAFCNNPFMAIPSTFPCFLFSCWITSTNLDRVGLVDLDRHDLGRGGVAVSVSALNGLIIECYDTSVNPIILVENFIPSGWPPSTTPNFFNILISADTPTNTLQIYVNDVNVPISPTWLNSNVIGNTKPDWSLFGSIADSCFGDMWFSNQSTFTDLSITANRRKFINADLSPVDVGENGQTPFGTPPPLFLHLDSTDTDISHFLANNGNGGSFSVSTDGFSVVAINGCGPYPSVTPPSPVPPTGACGGPTYFSVTFMWSPDPNNPTPDSYTLEYRQIGTTVWTVITGLTVTSYSVAASQGETFEWAVQAVYSGTPTDFSTIYDCTASINFSLARQGILGDYRNGNLYTFDPENLTDNGVRRRWLRSWRALEKPREETTRFSSLRIDLESGTVLTPAGTNPQCVLRWSDDGGHAWSNERILPMGKTGATAEPVKFNRLGSTRRFSRHDRIFELSGSDLAKVAIVGADVDIGELKGTNEA